MDENARLRLELEATKGLLKEALTREEVVTRRLNEMKRFHHVFRIPFAGEGEDFSPDSVLSHCYGALLPMFTTKDATVLRLLCREFKGTVADFPWEDKVTVIKGSVAKWKACFPKARCANLSRSWYRATPVTDADLAHLVGVRWVDISGCRGVTDAGFVHLKGVHTLNMSDCSQPSITEQAFSHLAGIHKLVMASCNQDSINDQAFSHIKGVHTLNMSKCSQATITDDAFAHLKGIHTLNMSECYQHTITDAAFAHLTGIHTLDMTYCSQSTITAAAFSHLEGIVSLKGRASLAKAAKDRGLEFTEEYVSDYSDYSW